jgi:hypothetical protein
MAIGFAIFFGLVSLLLLFMSFTFFKRKRIIENIPTSKVRSLALGLVEVVGIVTEPKEVFLSPITKKECAYYHLLIEETGDEEGRSFTYVNEEKQAEFYLQDSTGKILIEPELGEFYFDKKNNFFETYYGKVPPEVERLLKGSNYVQKRNKGIKVSEKCLPINSQAHILGSVEKSKEFGSLKIKRGRDKILIIGRADQKTLAKKFRNSALILLFFGFCGLGVVITIISKGIL